MPSDVNSLYIQQLQSPPLNLTCQSDIIIQRVLKALHSFFIRIFFEGSKQQGIDTVERRSIKRETKD